MPTIESFYPNNVSTGIPIGASIVIIFDVPLDEERFKANFFLFGPDFDTVTGPSNLQFLDSYGNRERYFLNSPGLSGDVPVDFEFLRLDSSNAVMTDPDYNDGNPTYRTKVIITPKKLLGPSTQFTTYMLGGADRGVSNKTVYDIQTVNQTGTSGTIQVRGGYIGTIAKTVVVDVLEAGDSRNSDYRWYYQGDSLNAISASTSRKWRSLLDTGVEIKFSGTDLAVGDTWQFNVYPASYLADNYSTTFTTGTGSIREVPDTASTSILGDLNNPAEESEFQVVATSPSDTEIKVEPSIKIIKVEFNNDIDATTINDKTVSVIVEATAGYDPSTTGIRKVNKFLYVTGKNLYIILQESK